MQQKGNERAQVAFAFCSPKEKGFKKNTGRAVALSRLKKRSVEVVLKDNENPREAMKRGLCEALFQRFDATVDSTTDDFEKFRNGADHWVPRWFVNALAYPRILEVTPRALLTAYVEKLLERCAIEYTLHRQRVRHRQLVRAEHDEEKNETSLVAEV